MPEPVFRDNPAESRYEALLGDDLIGQIDYTVAGGVVGFVHTGTSDRYRGRGLAARLTAFALADLRDRGRRVAPLCPFTAAYIAANPQYADLVARD